MSFPNRFYKEGTIRIQRAILLASGQLHFWMKEPPNMAEWIIDQFKVLDNLVSMYTNKVRIVWVG